ncbi:MAG: hypothetical protein ACERKD_09495 [Prolixibacteraceae bacterium]
MSTNKADKLKQMINKLPEFEPEALLWDRISSELDFAQQLQDAVEHLPDFEPEHHLWNEISAQLPESRLSKRTKIHLYRNIIAAASILIVIGLSILFTRDFSSTEYTLETEIVFSDYFSPNESHAEEQNALSLIESFCLNNQTPCNTNEFKEKIGLYNELENEALQLETAIETLGESPEMIKAMIRIENMKSQTIQELIKLVNS